LTCDIFIRSYWKDFPWLELCLASIARFCRGFRAVIVVVPQSSASRLRRIALPEGIGLRVEKCSDYSDDYLGQQVTKLFADRYSDADFIVHVDSDCIFVRDTSPQGLIPDGRPQIITRPYALLGRYWPYQRMTEEFLGWPITHDFMQRPPWTYPRWLYAALRDHCRATHAMEIEPYVTTRPPRGFSEFNALGALGHARHTDHFLWTDDSVEKPGEPFCRWYWSWEGIDEQKRREILALLGNPSTSLT
jgi:Family of unknown function (DUF6492)